MTESVTKMDGAGRIVIPKEIRERMGLAQDTTLLVSEVAGDIVILKKLDVKELARKLRQELKGANVEAISGKVEKKSHEQARRSYKALRN